MELKPEPALWPGVILSLVVWGANMFGDAVRYLLDPRQRGGMGRYGTAKRKRKKGFLARWINPFS